MILLAAVSQVVLLVIVLKLVSRAGVSKLLTTVLLFHAMLWYILPILLGLVVGRGIFASALVDSSDFVKFTVIETSSLIVTLLFMLRPKPYFAFIARLPLSQLELNPVTVLLVILVGFAISLSANWFSGLAPGSTYLDRNALLVSDIEVETLGTIGGISFIKEMLLSFGYLVLISQWPKRMVTNMILVFTFIWISYTILETLFNGGRIALLVPPMLLVMYACEREWPTRRLIGMVTGVAIVSILLGGLLSIVIVQQRAQELTIENSCEFTGVANGCGDD